MGNASEFKRAVKQVVDNVSFDKPTTVQIFEANIRVLGGLLSGNTKDLVAVLCFTLF